jgi:hypothetical protein
VTDLRETFRLAVGSDVTVDSTVSLSSSATASVPPRAPQGKQPSKLAPYGEDDGEAVNPMKLVKLKIVTGPSVWRFAGVGTRSSLR